MRYPLLAATAAALLTGLSPAAHAVVCSGTTMQVGNSGTATAAFLLGTGNCVAVSDKIFGEFASSGAITGNGSASFTFVNNPGNVTLGFAGVVAPSSVGTIAYSVQVDPALSQGFLIDALQKDLTFNAADPLAAATATLTGGLTAPVVIAFNCNRTVNPSGGTCPETHSFSPVDQISVSQTITTDSNAIVTALTDTIVQVAPVSEPASLALLGTGLIGFGIIARRRRQDDTGCAAV